MSFKFALTLFLGHLARLLALSVDTRGSNGSIFLDIIKPTDNSTVLFANLIQSTSSSAIITTELYPDSDYYDNFTTSDEELEDPLSLRHDEPFKAPQDPTEFMEYFESLINDFRKTVNGIFEKYMPQLFEMSSSVVLSADCTYDVVRTILAVREMKPWAIKLLDASGKVPEGILTGTFSSLGAYDECLETVIGDGPHDEDEKVATGQYCTVSIKPFLPPKPHFKSLTRLFNDAADAKGYPKEDHFSRLAPVFYYLRFRLGLCIPSSCTKDDLKAITGSLSNRLRLNVSVESCEVAEPFNVGREQVAAGGILALVLGLVLVATTMDVVRRLSSSKRRQAKAEASSSSATIKRLFTNCWLAFSAYANSSRVLSDKVPDDAVRSLYGLKVLSLIWIILAHAYLTLDLKAVGHLLATRDMNRDFIFQMVINASLAVETFFFISGLLVTLATLRRLRSNPAISCKQWLWFYVHRLVRMTPAVLLVIAIVLAAHQVSNGPLWREIIYPSAQRCREYWWIHMLHISNFFDVSKMCFLHLWYIAADMQLFVFTPFLLLILVKKPLVGKCLMIVLTLVSVLSTGIVTFLDHLPPTLMFDNPDPLSRKAFGNTILVKPYPHAAPYLIGMLTAYLLHVRPQLKLGRLTTCVGWVTSMLVTCCFIFITYEWNRGHQPSPVFAALYAAVFRSFWALAMAWVVVACQCGHGGIVNTILSWGPFIPMSRVSYTAYLIHPGLMYIFVASTRNLFMFSHFLVFYLFLSHLVATFVASFFLSLLIEFPFVALETALYRHFYGNSKLKSKYYYSVNPATNFSGVSESKQPPREDANVMNGTTISTVCVQIPLTEKLSNNSVDSSSGLMNQFRPRRHAVSRTIAVDN